MVVWYWVSGKLCQNCQDEMGMHIYETLLPRRRSLDLISDVHFYPFPTVQPISKGEHVSKGLVWRVVGVQQNTTLDFLDSPLIVFGWTPTTHQTKTLLTGSTVGKQ